MTIIIGVQVTSRKKEKQRNKRSNDKVVGVKGIKILEHAAPNIIKVKIPILPCLLTRYPARIELIIPIGGARANIILEVTSERPREKIR